MEPQEVRDLPTTEAKDEWLSTHAAALLVVWEAALILRRKQNDLTETGHDFDRLDRALEMLSL
jgi:hypothetical protein